MNRDDLQDWVRTQLAEHLNVYSVPCGMSWGVLAYKEQYEQYLKEKRK